MDSPKLIKELITEALELKGYSQEKLAQITGVPDRFMNALLEGDDARLPAAPYIRGYIKKIAGALELNAEELWRAYEREIPPRRAGAADRLPGNRFAIKTTNKKIITAVALGVLILLYAVLNTDRLIGEPRLTITHPTDETSSATYPSIDISGTLGNANDTLTINGEAVYVDESGAFKKSFPLEAGLNNFDIAAKRFLGKTNTVMRQVVYTPETTPTEKTELLPPL